MNTITNPTNYESLPVEELQIREEAYISLIDERRKDESRTYPLDDDERADLDVIRFFKGKKEHENDKVVVGDIFHTSWGYDQTNTEHFQVKEISPSGKTCKVIQIGQTTAPGSEGHMSESVYPDPKTIVNATPCRVKIERSTDFNPVTKQREEVGEIQLRGSVYYSRDSKHLTTLWRVSGKAYKSWYH